MSTHEYPTRPVLSGDLDSTMTLVGESGGLSSIVGEVEQSSNMPGFIRVETEHGPLYLDPEEEQDVLVVPHEFDAVPDDNTYPQLCTVCGQAEHSDDYRALHLTVDEQAAQSDDERFGPQDVDLLPPHLRTLKSALAYRRALGQVSNEDPAEIQRKIAETDRALTLHTGHHRVAAARAAGLLDKAPEQPDREPTAEDEAFWDQLEDWKRGGGS